MSESELLMKQTIVQLTDHVSTLLVEVSNLKRRVRTIENRLKEREE